MIAAFIERWHYKTSTFHLPVGEMTVTLDDVSAITNLPVDGRFYTFVRATKEDAQQTLQSELGLTDYAAELEVKAARGPHIRFTTLVTIIQERAVSQAVEDQMVAARAYLLLILGTTIFADKTWWAMKVKYLPLLHDLTDVGGYAWGAMVLAFMYDELRATSRRRCRQFSSFASLLQVCIVKLYYSIFMFF